MKNVKYIFTHPGVFHADEVFAIALLSIAVGKTPFLSPSSYEKVLNTGDSNSSKKFRIFREALPDVVPKEAVVIDFGGKWEPPTWLDHHQDRNLPASNILVLNSLIEDGIMPMKIGKKLEKHLFSQISEVDLGNKSSEYGSINSVISNFNQLDDGFQEALNVAIKITKAAIATAELAVKGEEIWASLAQNGRTKIQEEPNFIPGWKEMADEEGILMLVSPNVRGGWQIVSYDTNDLIIPEDPRQTFRHNSGFMAVYSSRDDAINHAAQIDWKHPKNYRECPYPNGSIEPDGSCSHCGSFH